MEWEWKPQASRVGEGPGVLDGAAAGPSCANQDLLTINDVGAVGIDALVELPERFEADSVEQLDLRAGIAGGYTIQNPAIG